MQEKQRAAKNGEKPKGTGTHGRAPPTTAVVGSARSDPDLS